MAQTLTKQQAPMPQVPLVVELLDERMLNIYWSKIEDELRRVPRLWKDLWTLESLYYRAMAHHMQVWVVGTPSVIQMVVMSQVSVYPAARVLEVVLAFGSDLDMMLPAIDAAMEKFAFDTGCSLIDVIGRRGWERKLAALGAEHVASVMRRRVTLKRTH